MNIQDFGTKKHSKMKVSGFTFIRNAIKYDYPIVEAIQSILPMCDEVVVAVGNSEDQTLELIQAIDPCKIKIIETTWDDALREGGRVLAVETDKAFHAISQDSDWAIYIQGDEVINEKYHENIRQGMKKCLNDYEIDGLLFRYQHFYGSYDYVGSSPSWYRNEIRIIRNNKNIFSYRDAQGFRKYPNEKLNVAALDAEVFHYGWVKDPRAMQRKQETFNKLWHDDEWVVRNIVKEDEFKYEEHISELKKFQGTHPKVMLERINKKNWVFDFDVSRNKTSLKDHFKNFLYKYLNIDVSYKNYRLKKRI
jgi:hypothetical protein